jgi:hypothetical protein
MRTTRSLSRNANTACSPRPRAACATSAHDAPAATLCASHFFRTRGAATRHSSPNHESSLSSTRRTSTASPGAGITAPASIIARSIMPPP